MTVIEQKTHEKLQSACKKITNPYDGCKVKVFNTFINNGIDGYEKAMNDFMATHHIINVIPTQSNHMHSTHIFYKE